MNDQTTVLKITHYLLENTTQKVYTITVPMKLGRVGCNINVEDTSVSSQHCLLIPDGLVLKVRDLNSTNGTFINKKKVAAGEEAILQEGDQLQFGKVAFTYSEQPIVAPKPTAPKQSANRSSASSSGGTSTYDLSYLRWVSYAVVAIGFLALQHPAEVSIPEDLAFLKSYLTSATFGLSAFLLSGPVILVNLFLHAYVCKKWLNQVRYPRVGSLLRVAALGPVMVAIVGCFVVLESLYPSNNLYISRVVTIRPVLVAQAAAKNLDPSSSRKYFEAIHTLLNTNPENTSNPQLELLLKNDRQSFMVRPTKSLRRPRA